MIRLFSIALLGLSIAACSSDSDSSSASSSASSSSGSGAACPNLAATWKVTAHCDPSLVGKDAVVTQSGCNLTFAAPFDGFTGTVTADNKVTIAGPQTCTGTASASSIALSCTPGTCAVTLSR
jgi:hypothetical protein